MLIGSRFGATGPRPPYYTPGIAPDRVDTAPLPTDVMDPGAAAAMPAKGKGVLDRIGEFLKSDQGRAALLRSAGATLEGGLGAGIKAGADYVDGQKASAAKSQQQGFENGLAERGASLAELRAKQADDLGWAGVDVDVRRLGETTRGAKAREGIDMRGQNVQMRGQDVTRANSMDGDATSRANTAAQVGASIYGKNLDYMSDQGRTAAGIGSKAGTAFTETRSEMPGSPAQDGWFSSSPAVPKTITTTRIPMAAGAGGASPPAQAIAVLKSNPNLAAQFDAKYGPGASTQFLGGR